MKVIGVRLGCFKIRRQSVKLLSQTCQNSNPEPLRLSVSFWVERTASKKEWATGCAHRDSVIGRALSGRRALRLVTGLTAEVGRPCSEQPTDGGQRMHAVPRKRFDTALLS